MGKGTLARSWGEWVLGHRLLVIIASLLIVGVAGFGMSKLSFNGDYRYFFEEGNPYRLAFDKLQNVYSKDDNVIIAIHAPEGESIYTKETLNLVYELTDKSWQIPYSYRVDSLTNFQSTTAKGDDLIVRDYVREDDVLDKQQLALIRDSATKEPLLAGQIVAHNGKATTINTRINLPGKDPLETAEIAAYVRQLTKEAKEKYPDHNFYLSGLTMMNNAFNEAGMKDMSTLTPLMYLVLIIIMILFLRSFFGTLATLVVLIFSVVAGMGIGGWLGIPLTPPSAMAPTVILTLAIADSVHILKSIFGLLRKGVEKTEAIIEGLRVNFQPVFLTSLTTIIGFLSLNVADTPPLHDLGNITAAGVTFAFLFSVTTLPVLISLFPVRIEKDLAAVEKEKTNFLAKLAGYVTTHRTVVIVVSVLIAGILFSQVPKIRLNDQFVNYFTKDIEFRSHTDWITKNMAGIYQLNYDLKAKESQGISDPAYLKKIDEFANMYRQIPEVTHVNSITDTFKRLNKNMHGDDESYYRLPDEREMAAQYLLLYEMSLPYGLDLNNQIDVDKSSTRVIITFGNVDTTRAIELGEIGDRWLKENAPAYMQTTGTSPTVMFSHITKRNLESMFWGTLLAFGLITLTLMIALKSWKYGLISLLPNMVPAGMALGIWSIGVGEAGFAISVVASVTLGIVVDDTVHFLSKYVRARREKGMNSIEAINDSFANVGAALVATTVILIAGFSIMMLSSFKMNWVLGALSAMTIAIALIVDFTFLPAMLSIIDRDKGVKS